MQVFVARSMLPVAGPPVQEAAVAVDGGRIVHCGARAEVLAAAGDGATVRDLGEAVLLPGLVNAHTHVELSWMGTEGNRPPGGDFVGWVRGVLERREREDRAVAVREADRAVERMLARGTVAIGDVSNSDWAPERLARSALWGIAFLELYGPRAADAQARIEGLVARLLALAGDDGVRAAGDRMRMVPTPHAPHTTSPILLRALAGRAAARGDPLSVHVAESRAESELLQEGGGPFADLLRERGLWDDAWSPPGQTPVEHLDRLGLLTERTLAVHCVQLGPGDHARLQARRATVVTCPRSNRYTGVGTAPVTRLLGEGVPVALGTDSLASAPDLDLFAEIAALRREHPRISRAAALRMATHNGAVALGIGDRLGTIERGKLARLTVVHMPAAGADPLEVVCSEPAGVFPLEEAPCDPPR
jgi:cytosine/adenosine deaminase-related metal-dependent hydrolase